MDPDELAAQLAELVRQQLEEALGPIMERLDALEARPADDGKPKVVILPPDPDHSSKTVETEYLRDSDGRIRGSISRTLAK